MQPLTFVLISVVSQSVVHRCLAPIVDERGRGRGREELEITASKSL